jgi:hypothetical protein
MATYSLKKYRRVSRDSTCGELMKLIEIEAPHLAAASRVVESGHLHDLDFRHDFAILDDNNGHPFVILWLSRPEPDA